jgi:hypothetical protein
VKDFTLAYNPAIEDLLITSQDRAMKTADDNVVLYASQLRGAFQDAQSMIHISTDLWTSPHRHAMLAVYSQLADEHFQLRKVLLVLLECRCGHSGEAQTALIAEIYVTSTSRK